MNNSFVKTAGVFSIVFAVIVIVSFVLFLTSGVEADLEKIEAYLQNVYNNTQYVISIWVFILGTLFLIPTVLGFYQALREAGRILWVALAVSLVGVTIILASPTITLGILGQLTAGYAEASINIRPALEVVAKTLLETANWAFILGLFLTFGIGVVLFSIGVLRTKVISHWLGWIGVVIGVLYVIVNILFPVFPTSSVFFVIAIVGVTPIFVWFIIIGVFLLRLREAA